MNLAPIRSVPGCVRAVPLNYDSGKEGSWSREMARLGDAGVQLQGCLFPLKLFSRPSIILAASLRRMPKRSVGRWSIFILRTVADENAGQTIREGKE